MAFGQTSGPPASAKQLAYLSSLLQDAGYDTFREARYPLGLTQRQAGGKFTTREASELIDRLIEGETGDEGDERRQAAAERANRAHEEAQAQLVAGLPAETMVLELERRGWTCSPPG